jgi:microcin C transport system substrate-binding protein
MTRHLTRRLVLALSAGAALGHGLVRGRSDTALATEAAEGIETHGMSSFGDLKYLADFKYFDYVEPNAPKGGVFSQIGPSRQFNQNFQTFNSLNSYILKGDAAWSSPSQA